MVVEQFLLVFNLFLNSFDFLHFQFLKAVLELGKLSLMFRNHALNAIYDLSRLKLFKVSLARYDSSLSLGDSVLH